MPKRIQRKRTKGWRMPPNCVYIGRPSKYGNPFKVDPMGIVHNNLTAKRLYRWALVTGHLAVTVEDIRRELRGKDICCWCREDESCHGDVLLEVANA